MGKLLKSLLIIIITLVLIVALAVGGVWAFCYFKYDVNVFACVSALNKLSSVPEESEIAKNQPQESDYNSVMDKINDALCISLSPEKVITYNEETKKYTIDAGNASKILTENLVLTDKETCALFNMILSSQTPEINTGSETINLNDYDFRLLEIDYSDLKSITAEGKTHIQNSFTAISSINLIDVKKKMNKFPLSILKGKVPDVLYISSTVVVSMEENTISYTVESKALNLNKVTHEQIKPVLKLVNNFIKIGEADVLNKQIGEMFVNGILGKEGSSGFAYSLVTTEVELLGKVAKSFAFTQNGENVVLTIYKN